MDKVASKLPSDFPKQLRRSIFSGIEERLKIMADRS